MSGAEIVRRATAVTASAALAPAARAVRRARSAFGGPRAKRATVSGTTAGIAAALPAAIAAVLGAAGPARAHEGQPPAPHDLWTAWSFEPGVVVPLVLAAGLYGFGLLRLWRRAGAGRGVSRWRAACFAGGVATLAVALVSPLDALGAALFSAHMAQHELLMLGAAPLLVLGLPVVPCLWALPLAWRRRLAAWARARPLRAAWSQATRPLVAWLLHGAALWVWHAPPLYQATLDGGAVHALQHASFLGTALLFWWACLHAGRRGRLGYGAGVLAVFTTAVHGSVLGALLAFAPAPWYPAYTPEITGAWGLTPLEDQQLGGLIMWVPAGVVYLGAALGLMAAWLGAAGRGRRSTGRRRALTRAAGGARGAVGRAAPLVLALLAAGCGGIQSMLEPAGEQARRVFTVWWVLFGVSAVVFVVVIGVLVYALFVRRESEEERPASDAGKTRVIVGASLATVVILIGLFIASLYAMDRPIGSPEDAAARVEVIGYRWWWEVRYLDADGEPIATSANEIHLPAGEPATIDVRSADVIHSFWMPTIHGKIDMLPGRTNRIRVRPERPGVFRGQCAEFCGQQHAKMAFMVVVHPDGEFAGWLAREAEPAPEPRDSLARAGLRVFMEDGCAGCHAIRGTDARGELGPDLTHLASRLTLAAAELPNTKGHLGGWIANPQQVKPGNNMPAVPLEPERFQALLHYLQTLE